MTPAERYANSLVTLVPTDQVWELPKSAHIIAGVFAVTGAGLGATLAGTPVTAAVGFVAGGLVGYGVYKVAEHFAGSAIDRGTDLEQRVVDRFVEMRRHDLRPLGHSELLRMRRELM
jgi:hypothetical protein